MKNRNPKPDHITLAYRSLVKRLGHHPVSAAARKKARLALQRQLTEQRLPFLTGGVGDK